MTLERDKTPNKVIDGIRTKRSAVTDADWQLSRRMTATQYRAALARLKLNRSSGGRFLGVTPRTSARYANGEAEVPEGYALLLGLMIHLEIQPVVPKRRKTA